MGIDTYSAAFRIHLCGTLSSFGSWQTKPYAFFPCFFQELKKKKKPQINTFSKFVWKRGDFFKTRRRISRRALLFLPVCLVLFLFWQAASVLEDIFALFWFAVKRSPRWYVPASAILLFLLSTAAAVKAAHTNQQIRSWVHVRNDHV